MSVVYCRLLFITINWYPLLDNYRPPAVTHSLILKLLCTGRSRHCIFLVVLTPIKTRGILKAIELVIKPPKMLMCSGACPDYEG